MAARTLAASCALAVLVCAALRAAAATASTSYAAGPSARGGIGGACNTTSNCSANMVCLGGKCYCTNVSIPINETCVNVTTTWEGPCDTKDQCLLWNRSVCLNKKCVCPIGLTFLNNTCSNITAPSCSSAAQCPSGSNCTAGKCACPKDQVYMMGKCMATQGKIGGTCSLTLPCYLPNDNNDQHVECKTFKCNCVNGYKPNTNNDSCGGCVTFVASALTVLLAVIITRLT